MEKVLQTISKVLRLALRAIRAFLRILAREEAETTPKAERLKLPEKPVTELTLTLSAEAEKLLLQLVQELLNN